MSIKKFIISVSAISVLAANVAGFAKQSFNQFLQSVKAQAIEEGVRPSVVDKALRGLTYHKKIVKLDKRQPEKRTTYYQYRNKRADAYRIKLGQKKYKKYGGLLNQIGREYQVDPCILASIWGLETSYGHYMGSFSVIKSLATLSYEGRRGKFFRKQLIQALKMLNEGHVKLKDFKGEWAGGSGHPQFMPSSWHHFAVDHDGDGKKDIWKNHADAFASMANYLHKSGWEYGKPWAVQVHVPPGFDKNLLTSKIRKNVHDWQEMGVRVAGGDHFPRGMTPASIIHPYGGPYLMIFKNWRVIKLYNRSDYYAGTIGYMANKICRR